MHIKEQRFGDDNFSGGEIILIGQYFAVESQSLLNQALPFCRQLMIQKQTIVFCQEMLAGFAKA